MKRLSLILSMLVSANANAQENKIIEKLEYLRQQILVCMGASVIADKGLHFSFLLSFILSFLVLTFSFIV